jgi:hypothetical protein
VLHYSSVNQTMGWTFYNFHLVSLFERRIWPFTSRSPNFVTPFWNFEVIYTSCVHRDKVSCKKLHWEFWRCCALQSSFLPDIPTQIRLAGNIILCDFPQNSSTLHIMLKLNIQRWNGLLVSGVPCLINVGGTETCLNSYRQLSHKRPTVTFVSESD